MSHQAIAALLFCSSLLIVLCIQLHQYVPTRRQDAPPSPFKFVQPAKVRRDDDGWWCHPDLPDFEEDYQAYKCWLIAQGLETKFDSLEDEDSQHPAYVAYYGEEACHVRDWTCTPPAGEGWFVLSIHDSEDGPQWVWARRVGSAAIMASIHAEALAYHERFYATVLPSGQRYSGSRFKNNGKPVLLRGTGARSIFCDVDE